MHTDQPDKAARGRYAGLTIALLLAVSLQAATIVRSPVIAKDAIVFIRVARLLTQDVSSVLRWEDQHPGYPVMLLAMRPLARVFTGADDFHEWILAARLASGLCGVACVGFMWLLTRRIFSPRVADAAAILAAVCPLLRQNASDALSDAPHLAFYLAAAWLACEGMVRGRAAWFAGAGLASGLAYWVRPEGLIVALVAAAGLVVGRAFRWWMPWRKVAVNLAALAAVAAIVVAPYMVLAGKLTSKKIPFAGARERADINLAALPPGLVTTMAATNPAVASGAASSASDDKPGGESASDSGGLLAEPAIGDPLPDERPRSASAMGMLAAGFYELGKELAQGFRYLLLIPLALGAFVPRGPRWQPIPTVLMSTLLVMHIALLVALYCVAGYISHRHVMPVLAILLPTAAGGLVLVADVASAVTRRRLPIGAALSALLLIVVALLAPKCVRPMHDVYFPIVEAAQWVKQRAQPGDAVLATSPYVRFYAGVDGLVLGPEVATLESGMASAPSEHGWRFLTLEVDRRTFTAHTLQGGPTQYHEIAEFGGHPTRPWYKVLVFEPVSRHGAQTASRTSRMKFIPLKAVPELSSLQRGERKTE